MNAAKIMDLVHENSRLENVIQALRQKKESRRKTQSEKTHVVKSVNGTYRVSRHGSQRESDEECSNEFCEECLATDLWAAKLKEKRRLDAVQKEMYLETAAAERKKKDEEDAFAKSKVVNHFLDLFFFSSLS